MDVSVPSARGTPIESGKGKGKGKAVIFYDDVTAHGSASLLDRNYSIPQIRGFSFLFYCLFQSFDIVFGLLKPVSFSFVEIW